MLYALAILYCFEMPAVNGRHIPCGSIFKRDQYESVEACEAAGAKALEKAIETMRARGRSEIHWSEIICAPFFGPSIEDI